MHKQYAVSHAEKSDFVCGSDDKQKLHTVNHNKQLSRQGSYMSKMTYKPSILGHTDIVFGL